VNWGGMKASRREGVKEGVMKDYLSMTTGQRENLDGRKKKKVRRKPNRRRTGGEHCAGPIRTAGVPHSARKETDERGAGGEDNSEPKLVESNHRPRREQFGGRKRRGLEIR